MVISWAQMCGGQIPGGKCPVTFFLRFSPVALSGHGRRAFIVSLAHACTVYTSFTTGYVECCVRYMEPQAVIFLVPATKVGRRALSIAGVGPSVRLSAANVPSSKSVRYSCGYH